MWSRAEVMYNTQAILTCPIPHPKYTPALYINATNLHAMSVYFSAQHCIKPTWINDRDQFYSSYNESWQEDIEFLDDYLI